MTTDYFTPGKLYKLADWHLRYWYLSKTINWYLFCDNSKVVPQADRILLHAGCVIMCTHNTDASHFLYKDYNIKLPHWQSLMKIENLVEWELYE